MDRPGVRVHHGREFGRRPWRRIRRQRSTDARVIEIDTRRVLARKQHHFAVIDIGSNSIRLVVYDDLSRAPFPRFNEKSFCALGAGLDETGRLSRRRRSSMRCNAVGRFEAIARAMQVETVHVLATEATRRASNGADSSTRSATRPASRRGVLSGHEEATYAALGVISGFFQPKGLTGDMGGGSLEVAEVLGDRVGERMVSMPLGALPVDGDAGGGRRRGEEADRRDPRRLAAAAADRARSSTRSAAAGGRWRGCTSRRTARRSASCTATRSTPTRCGRSPRGSRGCRPRRSRRSPTCRAGGSTRCRRRRSSSTACCRQLQARARRLLDVRPARGLALRPARPTRSRYRDPLLEGAQAIGLPAARVPEFSAALARWTDDLFPGETQGDRRLRLAVCALTDVAWRDHEKVRALESFRRLLQFPFIGITHPERAFLAVAIMARYGGNVDDTVRAVTQRPAAARASCAAPRSSAGCCCSATASRPACPRSSTRRASGIGTNARAARGAERRARPRQRRRADAPPPARAGQPASKAPRSSRPEPSR